MSKNQTQTAMPKLRFPEFRNNKAWETITIGDVASKDIRWSFTGGPFGSNLKSSDYTEDGIRVIQLQNIGDGHFLNDYKIFTSEEKADELLSCNIYPGDIILSKMGDPVARACLIPNIHKRYVMCSDGIRLAVDKNKFNTFFIYSLLNSATFRNLAEESSTGSTRKRIGIDVLRNIEITTPKLPEQQKIADCLSSLDEEIAAEGQKLNALQDHKKGLMQQIFPAEDETLPKLRFPEFKDAPKWEIKPLGRLSTIVRGGSPRPIDEYITIEKNGLNWLKIGDVDKSAKYITSTKEKVRIEALRKTREVNPGDLIMSNSMSFGRPYMLKIKSCIHDGWIAISKIRHNISADYLYYIILSECSQRYFQRSAAGSGVKNLNADIIKLLPISLPKLAEQQKIVECLSSIDALITTQSLMIEAMQEHKKGLMQQLFPSAEEVMG